MVKILAFSGSNSSTSINHSFLKYIQKNHLNELQLLELRTLNIPVYSFDEEKNNGIPSMIHTLFQEIQSADILLIACPEHNGNYTSYFKATIDWLSRYDRTFIEGKQIFLVGTSTGRGGAESSIQSSKKLLERLKAEVFATYSLPSYEYVFENDQLIAEHNLLLTQFISLIPR